MKKATAAISQGMGGAFLQTSAASVLKQLSITMDISSMDREMITSFLTQGQASGYAPASGQIVGIFSGKSREPFVIKICCFFVPLLSPSGPLVLPSGPLVVPSGLV